MSPAFPPYSYDIDYMPLDRGTGNSPYSTFAMTSNPVQSRPLTTCADLSKPHTAPQDSFDWSEHLDGIVHTASKASNSEEKEEKPSHTTEDQYSPLDVFCEPVPEDGSHALDTVALDAVPSKKRSASTCQTNGTSLRRKKKPKCLPKRPLSAYNLYFQHLRANLNESEDTKLGFHELGKIVGKQWKALPEEERKTFQHLADQDTERYRREMEDHKKMEEQKEREQSEQAQKMQHHQSQHSLFPNQQHRTSSHTHYESSSHSGYGVRHRYPQPAATSYSTNYHPRFPHSGEQYSAASSPPWAGSHPSTVARPTPVHTTNTASGGRSNDRGEHEANLHRLSSLPAGSEVSLRDADGELRTYVVQYRMVTMSRREADEYLARIS